MKIKILCLLSVLFLILTFVQAKEAQTNDDKSRSKDKTERITDEKIKNRPFKIVKNSFPRDISGRCSPDIIVRLRVTFHSSSKVSDVEIVSPSGCEQFDRAAVTAATKIKFQPQVKDGEPVTNVKVIEYTYRKV